mgnify:CR=1 FL=1
MTTKRGTSNGNASGSAEDRRRRKAWLLETYAADTKAWVYQFFDGAIEAVEPGALHVRAWLEPYILRQDILACRCYRCGKLLIFETLTVDRIIPGCQGGTYRRNNIRPACGKCNSETGGAVRRKG